MYRQIGNFLISAGLCTTLIFGALLSHSARAEGPPGGPLHVCLHNSCTGCYKEWGVCWGVCIWPLPPAAPIAGNCSACNSCTVWRGCVCEMQ
jgi:hypothetical protein